MRLNQTIVNHFSAAELTELAAELGAAGYVRDDAPPDARAADLLAALAATGRAAAVTAALAARRPDVDWAALPWPPAALAALHDALDRRLDRDGLRDLCLRLGIDHDNLPGESKRARVRELLLAMERAGRTAELSDDLHMKSGSALVPRRSSLVTRLVTRRSSLVTLFLCLLAAWLFWRDGRGWAAGPALPEGVIGVAVAEFAETADCRAAPRGREASALVYETLGRELAAAGLSRRVALTRVGRVCEAAAAATAGQKVGATVVIWGWLPQMTDGLVAAFTPTGPAPAASADLARAFEALFTGPDESLSLRLSGRAVVLSRFLLGLLYAGQGEHAVAEALYSAAITNVDAAGSAILQNRALPAAPSEARRTLAVLLTERGKARAALGRAAEARADFDAAEAYNPDYLRLLVARAAEAYGRRDWAAAEAYLSRAALQDEPLPTIAYGFGLLDYYRGRYAAAVAQFDRAIALSAADGSPAAVYHLARGYSYVELGDCATAAADFRAARDEVSAPAAVRVAAGGVPCGVVADDSAAEQAAAGGGVGGRPAGEGQATAMIVASVGRLSPLAMAAAAVDATAAEPSPSTTASPPISCTAAPQHSCSSAVAPTPGPLLLEIGPRGANVRRGPGAEYAVMVTRRAGDHMEVLAANVSGEWYQVRVPGQGRGWVSAAYAVALGDVEPLGIRNYELGIEDPRSMATVIGTTPEPSATPRPMGSPTPLWTPPGQPTAATPTPTAPAPPSPLPTRTPPASLPQPPTPTLLPPPTARAGGN